MQSFNNYINFIFSTRLTVDKQIPTYLDIWNATYLLHSKLNSCGKSNRTHCSKLNLEHSITDCNSPSKLVRNEPNSNPAVGQPLSHTQHTHTIAQSPTHMHAQTQTKAACGFDRANHSHINIRALCANFLAFWDLKNWTGMWMVLFSTKLGLISQISNQSNYRTSYRTPPRGYGMVWLSVRLCRTVPAGGQHAMIAPLCTTNTSTADEEGLLFCQ